MKKIENGAKSKILLFIFFSRSILREKQTKQRGIKMPTTAQEIAVLRRERKAVILAHNYVSGDIQDIADFTGDSLELSVKAKEIKAKVTKVVVKEIRFGPNTDDHDYNFKLKHAENFLKEGAKVKAYVFFRGRQIVFKDQGEILLLRFATDLEDLAKVEQMPRLEGKRMILVLAPKPKK